MVFRNLFFVPYGWFKLCWYASHAERYSEEQRYQLLKYVDNRAVKGGNLVIDGHGMENIPKENGFIFFPNHQGLFDVLAIIQVCPVPFSVVAKKELTNVPFLKQVFACMKAFMIDRDDVKQSMQVIINVIKEVKAGRNYLIFAEGTRSRKGNQLLDFKGGSFKSAVKAKWIGMNPSIIIMDEPTRGIDVGAKRDIYDLMNELTSQGVAIIMVSSELPEVIGMSDRILVLNHGALEQAGSPIDIYTHPATRFAAEFVGQSNFIDDQRMFRPEFAEIIDLKKNSSSNHSLIFSARVEQTEYIGGRWLIDVSVGDKHWRLAHSAPQTIGSQIHIAVNPAGIVTISG